MERTETTKEAGFPFKNQANVSMKSLLERFSSEANTKLNSSGHDSWQSQLNSKSRNRLFPAMITLPGTTRKLGSSAAN